MLAKIKGQAQKLKTEGRFPSIILGIFMMTVTIIVTGLMGLGMLAVILIAFTVFFASLEYSGFNILKKFRTILGKLWPARKNK